MTNVTAPTTVRDATAPPRTARQHIRFAFYRLRPEWRLRPPAERAADREEVGALVREMGEREGVLIRPYRLVGTRGDTNFMLWLVSGGLDDLHEFSAPLHRVRVPGALGAPHHT